MSSAQELRDIRYTTSSARALYVHVPFCASKCAYCDFASAYVPRVSPLARDYTIALQHHIDWAVAIGLTEEVSTAYIGGGTPTYLDTWLWWLAQTVARSAPITEFTCEANPDSLTDELLGELASQGVNRFSLGVQSMSDAELRRLGRIHDAARARERIRAVAREGLRVSADLMCAIPLQTDESWEYALRTVVERGAGHVSCYPLQIEDGTPFGRAVARGTQAPPDPEVAAHRMEMAESILGSAGLRRYEVASYARPGQECAHNRAYWDGQPYLGFGTASSSMLTRAGYERLSRAVWLLPKPPMDLFRARLTVTSTPRQIARDDSLSTTHYAIELMDRRQALAEDLMLAMRTVAGASEALIGLARQEMGAELDDALARVIARGLVKEQPDGSVAPTHLGWLLGNELYGEMWGLSRGTIVNVVC